MNRARNRDRKSDRWLSRIRRVWITAGLVFTVVFTGWSLWAYRADADAHAALVSDDQVMVQHDDGVWSFVPTRGDSSRRDGAALVFFPGALVDPVAYAPLLRAVAAGGYRAYLVEIPRRAAFGGADSPELEARLARVVAGAASPARWVAAGHSKGGVVASTVASQQRPGFSGLVLIGTSHPRDVDLSGLTVPVTKIVGTHDGLASRAEVESNRGKLPLSTRWEWVEGGNHSQFGWYGFQPGDRWPHITAAAQRDLMIRRVLDMLADVTGHPPSLPLS